MSAPDPKAVEAALPLLDLLANDRTVSSDLRQAARDVVAAARAYLRAPTAPQGAEPVACPDHHYRAGGYCPHCQSHLHPAVCDLSQREYDDLVRDAMKWRARAIADAAPQGAEVARDAARYRALRDCDLDTGPCIAEHRVNDWGNWYWAILTDDAEIDAALTPTDAEAKG